MIKYLQNLHIATFTKKLNLDILKAKCNRENTDQRSTDYQWNQMLLKEIKFFQFKNGVTGFVQVAAQNRNFLLQLHLKQNYICSSRALYLCLESLALRKSTPKTAARTSSSSRTCSSTFSSSSQGVNFLRMHWKVVKYHLSYHDLYPLTNFSVPVRL